MMGYPEVWPCVLCRAVDDADLSFGRELRRAGFLLWEERMAWPLSWRETTELCLGHYRKRFIVGLQPLECKRKSGGLAEAGAGAGHHRGSGYWREVDEGVAREPGVMMGKIVFDDEPDNIPGADYNGVNFVDKKCRVRMSSVTMKKRTEESRVGGFVV